MRNPTQFLGVGPDKCVFENRSEAVFNADLPSVLSEEVIDSDALVGYVTRMAWKKVCKNLSYANSRVIGINSCWIIVERPRPKTE